MAPNAYPHVLLITIAVIHICDPQVSNLPDRSCAKHQNHRAAAPELRPASRPKALKHQHYGPLEECPWQNRANGTIASETNKIGITNNDHGRRWLQCCKIPPDCTNRPVGHLPDRLRQITNKKTGKDWQTAGFNFIIEHLTESLPRQDRNNVLRKHQYT